jgi:hypothetical protein
MGRQARRETETSVLFSWPAPTAAQPVQPNVLTGDYGLVPRRLGPRPGQQ